MVLRGALGYALVLVGGLVVSILPESTPIARLPLLQPLRESTPGRVVGLTVVIVGLGLATSAWLQLVRYVGAGEGENTAERIMLVRRATVLWCLPLLLAPAMFSRDGWSYAAQGEMTRLGLSPYEWTPSVLSGPIVEAVDPRWAHVLTPYGPLPLVWGSVAARLTDDPWLLVIAYRLLALAGLALLAYAVPRMASWTGRDPAVASALAVASPLVLAHGVAGVHNDLVMAGLVALALVVAVEHRWVAGAVLAGAAAAVKIPAGVVGIGVALVALPVSPAMPRRLRRLVSVAGLATATMALVGVCWGLGVGWVHALGVPGEVQTPLSLTTQLGRLAGAVLDLAGGGAEPRAVTVARALGSVTALAVAGGVALRAPAGRPATAVRAVGLLMIAVLALSPVVHPWYLLWAVPLLAACHLGERASAALLHGSWLFGLTAPLDSSLAGAGAAIAIGVVFVGAIAGRQLVASRWSSADPGREHGWGPQRQRDAPTRATVPLSRFTTRVDRPFAERSTSRPAE